MITYDSNYFTERDLLGGAWEVVDRQVFVYRTGNVYFQNPEKANEHSFDMGASDVEVLVVPLSPRLVDKVRIDRLRRLMAELQAFGPKEE